MTALHDQRMQRFLDAGLYLVTSERFSAGRSTLDILRMALDSGVRLVQLREKELPVRALVKLAEQARSLTTDAGALLLLNDHVDIALAVGADGVHLGLEDFPVAAARRISPDLIIGASSHSVEEARAAEADGASYVNIGPLFPTGTKTWEGQFLGWQGLRQIAQAITVPYTVMGGIKIEHIAGLTRCGARTIAVVTAVTAAPDPGIAARYLLEQIRQDIRGVGRH